MAPSSKKAEAVPAEVSLQQLRGCLVNLPAPLVGLLTNVLTQNVVVELNWRQASDKKDGKPIPRSIYVGWTGMMSKRKSAQPTTAGGKDPNVLEIDSTFAKLIGFSEGFKVGILLHTNAPQAHTVNIEPLTAADWEIIELHPEFLETHFLSQIRALPNPSYESSQAFLNHPLTLHLSPTLTANVVVTSLKPSVSRSIPVAKISGNDSEVIVAPKSRQRTTKAGDEDGQSTKSIANRSSGTAGRAKGGSSDDRRPLYFRGVSRQVAAGWFDQTEDAEKDEGLKIWLDWTIISSKDLRGINWGWVTIVRPSGLQASSEESSESTRPASRIVAQICPWEDAPNTKHAALSSNLCATLGATDACGNIVRIEPAPPQASKSVVRSLRIFPFTDSSTREKDGLRLGGHKDRSELAERILEGHSGSHSRSRLLDGPITDGMILPPSEDLEDLTGWRGGIVKLQPSPGPPLDPAKTTRGWLLGSDRKLVVLSQGPGSPKPSSNDRRLSLEIMGEMPRPSSAANQSLLGEPMKEECPDLVGVDEVIEKVSSNLQYSSSVLLTGGLGAGKTDVAQHIGHSLRKDHLFNVSYFPCHSFVKDERPMSAIKDTLERLFALASWSTLLGGRALVILDNLDTLCPVETELDMGGNERTRLASELLMTVVKEYCSGESGVVLLATAQSKESVHNNVIAGHIIGDIVHLYAPSKEVRRQILDHQVHKESTSRTHGKVNGEAHSDIDYLDLAGRTDGFMPGDLVLLVQRARHEALIRTISSSYPTNSINLTSKDFIAALSGFTPSSLRKVTLQHSSTTFSSVGGLTSTCQTLRETLQYPTLYAPIFAKCPLRLRSGLLLYGYPGCGKTLLASAVAGECGLNFISVKGPEILNKYIGASEKSVRDLFERAQAARPCVLFFDEFDSIAPKRGHDSTGVTDRVVNQMLTQMDGAEGLSGVYVLAATSRPDLIDPALLRPGRLDKSLLCDMPRQIEERLHIIKTLSNELRMGDTALANLKTLARRTEEYSGADLQGLVSTAHLEAVHDILGDTKDLSASKSRSTPTSSFHGGSAKIPNFTYFRMGDTDDENTDNSPSDQTTPLSSAKRAAERAEIEQKLRAHYEALRRAKAARRGLLASSDDVNNNTAASGKQDAKGQVVAVVIHWKHIERALAQTKPSISPEEARRLKRIYDEFVDSRSGEMPSGQGGSEIGGRSSLM
ncbi:MAG: Peroxisome biosynthesis protein pex1 [Alyxoria varia]|nr:MAG: Peroxisome biosynthesis protein pex1 [Alyxoria varia]